MKFQVKHLVIAAIMFAVFASYVVLSGNTPKAPATPPKVDDEPPPPKVDDEPPPPPKVDDEPPPPKVDDEPTA